MSDLKPPRFVLDLLQWFCPTHLYEEIEGDLIQRYNRDVTTIGASRAKAKLMMSAVRFFRPGILARNKFSYKINRNLMFGNYSRLIARQAARNKTFSAINILGLTIGITVCLLIAQFLQFEYSFESHLKNARRTYRINLYNTQNGVFTSIDRSTVPALAYAIQQTVPGVQTITRVSSRTQAVVSNKERHLKEKEDNIVFADPSIVEVLSLDLVDGDKRRVLRDPKSIIISASAALKYFGTTAVTGRALDFGFNNNSLETIPYQIQGVFRDTPITSHQQFQFVLPPENAQAWNENWAWSDVKTYVVLSEGIDPSNLDEAFAKIVKQHHQDGTGDRYILEPIRAIRLHAVDGTGRASLVNFFTLLGVIILLLSWFNYTNLSTARFLERMKEVGVRKVIGASRIQLVIQFLMESFFFNFVSFSLGVIFFFICWPQATTYLDQNVPITLFENPQSYIAGAFFIFASTLLSGFYPSLFLSSFKPLASLKGMVAGIADRSTLRKVIVTIQLSVSIALVTAVIVIQRQIAFMQSQNLGISIDQTLIIEGTLVSDGTTVTKYETVKNELLKLSSVKGVTNASSFPGKEIDWHRTDITLGEENGAYKYNSRIIAIGTEFLDLFGVGLVAGRNFDPSIESDKKAMLISEEAGKMFGFKNPIDALGKLIFIGSRRFEVIGVIKNYHYRTLQSRIEPLLYMQNYPRGPALAIKIAPDKLNETIPQIKSTWEQAYAGNVFRYYFLDEFFDRQYHSEEQLERAVTTLTILAIVIACSGLFALSLHSVGRRAKEISIRKVFGATISNVVFILSRDLIILMVIAGALTLPLMFVMVRQWLGGYAYKMPIDGWIFIIPLMTVVLLVLITISSQTIRAARRNPVENMKYE